MGPLRPEHLRDLPPGAKAIIVDTVTSIPPGELEGVALIDLSGREDPLQASSAVEQRLDEVVAMAQLLRGEPLTGRFVGLGVDSVDLNKPPPIDAVQAMRSAVVSVIKELAAS